MNTIKEMLKEELDYALSLRRHYENILKMFPRGSLSNKQIKGRFYTYLQYREGGKVIGRVLSKEESESYKAEFERRNEYRSLLKATKEKIEFITKALSEWTHQRKKEKIHGKQ